MRNRFLARAIAAVAVFATVLLPASPAAADRDSERPRAGASTWVPRYVSFDSWQVGNDRARLIFEFRWDSNTKQRFDNDGDFQTFEMNAAIPCDWLQTATWSGTTQGYDAAYWDTNIPGAALPFEDTIFLDECDPPWLVPNDSVNFGFGVLDVSELVAGTTYYVELGARASAYSLWDQGNIKLTVQAGTRLDVDEVMVSYDDPDCTWTSTEMQTGNWNAATQAAMDKRLEAAWCSWPDFTHVIADDEFGYLKTEQYKNFWGTSYGVGRIYNPSFETSGATNTGAAGWGLGWTGSASAARYCNDPAPAFDGNCFVQFNNGNGLYPAQVFTSVTDLRHITGGHVTAEAAVRCRNGSTCYPILEVRTTPLTGTPVQYVYSEGSAEDPSAAIPDDGHWYVCRIDFDHAGTHYPTDGTPAKLDSASNGYKFYVHNGDATIATGPTGNMDVDFTFLGGKTDYVDAEYSEMGFTIDPDGQIGTDGHTDGDLPTCTQM